jgi:acetyltransferase-like isoleucine patch superfamily enzyme
MGKTSFLSRRQIVQMGFGHLGKNVLISQNATFYNCSKIRIGDNVRIDDFCLLSGDIAIGSNIHIGAYCALYGSYGIVMEDYSGLSPKCIIFSATDDFGGDYFISPMQPAEYTNVTGGKVHIRRFSQLGAGTVVMPKVTIEEGAVTGACTLVNRDLKTWSIYTGIPAKLLRERKKGVLDKYEQIISGD